MCDPSTVVKAYFYLLQVWDMAIGTLWFAFC